MIAIADILSSVVSVLWVWPMFCWCMCFYVVFASGEGFHWFNFRLNPFLLMLAIGGALVWGLGFDAPRPLSVGLAACAWSFYAMLVSAQSWRFRLWRRHILPVCAPMFVLLAWAVSQHIL